MKNFVIKYKFFIIVFTIWSFLYFNNLFAQYYTPINSSLCESSLINYKSSVSYCSNSIWLKANMQKNYDFFMKFYDKPDMWDDKFLDNFYFSYQMCLHFKCKLNDEKYLENRYICSKYNQHCLADLIYYAYNKNEIFSKNIEFYKDFNENKVCYNGIDKLLKINSKFIIDKNLCANFNIEKIYFSVKREYDLPEINPFSYFDH